MWLSKKFDCRGHVEHFLNMNKNLVSNVSITIDRSWFVVFFYTDTPHLITDV